MRSLALVLVLAVAAALPLTADAKQAVEPPTPDPNFATTITPRPCTPEAGNPYEKASFAAEGWAGPNHERYPGACQRLKFVFGPITVKPGQNDVLIQPVTIEKPNQDGYITRFDPDLVDATGAVPPIENIHLHHGTWLSIPTDYGSGPFFASGEEKTIGVFPRGYGMPIKATDTWQLLYMVHSAVANPQVVYITYDVDFIPTAKANALPADQKIKDAFPYWLDVQETGSGYPVFNTQRPFGDAEGTCTWPKERCAAFDSYGKKQKGQGEKGNDVGRVQTIPTTFGRGAAFTGGTIITIGGHVHPGGLTNDIDLKRGDDVKRIYTGQAKYWDRTDSTKVGGPPNSWDFSMTVSNLPFWGVRVKPGDKLISNATYDTTLQSTYENMGIAVALIAPDKNGGPVAPGLDAFDPAVGADTADGCPSGGLLASPPTLCDKGFITHGHLAENDNFGGPTPPGDLFAKKGQATSRVEMANFLYTPGDFSLISMTGVPSAKLGSKLTFFNEDAAADIYHTVTSCAFPCTGRVGTAFPLADGKTSSGTQIDFDSSELGIGPNTIGPTKNELSWDLDLNGATYKAGDLVSYYCRIHPFMRGSFEVTP